MAFVESCTPRASAPTVRLTRGAHSANLRSWPSACRPPRQRGRAPRLGPRRGGHGPRPPGSTRAPRLLRTLSHLSRRRGGNRARPGGRPVPGDVAAVVTTSGTTAEPRHVVLTRQAMESSARAVCRARRRPREDQWLSCLPLHHVAGLAIIARSHFCHTALTVHPSFDVDSVGEAAGRCTVVSLVPTMLSRLLDAGVPLRRFRRVLLGGSPVAPSLLGQAEEVGVG